MSETTNPIVKMSGIVKRFPGVVANAGVDFELLPGEVHSLLGENGAGKTTLMNILYGLYTADAGEVWLRGKRVAFNSPHAAIAQGLGMVHQHFMLVQPFTVAENIVLGQRSPRPPFLEKKADVCRRIEELSQKYGLALSPEAPVWTLSVGEQQRVEILKALYRGAEVLILDEPTAVLTPQEADELLIILCHLAEEGKSVVFISHKLGEVLAASDRISVLRDGKLVDTVAGTETDKQALARMMVGRDVTMQVAKGPAQPGEVRLALHDVQAQGDRHLPALRGISLEVRAGEILGIAGVDGNGQRELEEVIAGLRPLAGGTIRLGDHDIGGASPRQVGCCGLAHVPSDRYRMGVLPDFSVAENLVLQRIGDPPFTRGGWLRREIIQSTARDLVAKFDIRTPSIETQTGALSGGNVQKAILARELARQPMVLLAAQPTRGLDVSAIEFVHRKIVEQRDAGMAILLISTELDEILALSDRIAVMYEGEIVGQMDAAQADAGELGLLMAGQHRYDGKAVASGNRIKRREGI